MGVLVRIVAMSLVSCAVAAGCRPALQMPKSTARDDKAKIAIWKPDPELVGQLTQTVNVDNYQISLAEDFTSAGTKRLNDHSVQYGWKRQSGVKDGAAVLSVVVNSDKNIAEKTKDLENALLSFWRGMVEASIIIENAKPEQAESGSINGISFCRFKWSGSAKIGRSQIKGWAYGALDGDVLFQFVSMDFGEDAENGRRLMETALATFKKR